jgi:hypothetical protein
MNELKSYLKKGLTYALCFWVVYKLLNALWYAGSSSQEDQAKTAQDEYVRQQKKAAELMTESERQFNRMDALMTKQEENARRFDAVITQMEKAFQK